MPRGVTGEGQNSVCKLSLPDIGSQSLLWFGVVELNVINLAEET